MTLEEMKIKVYALIEEYSEDADDLTEDIDLSTKINSVINQIQNELARFKKINAYQELEVEEGDVVTLKDELSDFYQLNLIRGVSHEIIGDRVLFNESGTAKVFYYKYPKQIDENTSDTHKLELSTDALEIMPYGVAGDLLKSDVSNQYGQVYFNRYKQMINELDPREAMPTVEIAGGINV